LAGGRAAVAVRGVAVVALLADVNDLVAARLQTTEPGAAVAAHVVAVVALLTGLDDAVATVPRLHGGEARDGVDRGHDLRAHHAAEHQVDVLHAAQEVAVAHDRTARLHDRAAVAVRLGVVAAVERRAVAVGVRRAEVVTELVGHDDQVPHRA